VSRPRFTITWAGMSRQVTTISLPPIGVDRRRSRRGRANCAVQCANWSSHAPLARDGVDPLETVPGAGLIVVTGATFRPRLIVKRGRDTARARCRSLPDGDRPGPRCVRARAVSDGYLADWRRSEPRACGDDIEQEARTEAQRLGHTTATRTWNG